MRPGRQIYLSIKNKKGILLFEVVVAVTILAIGLTMVSRSFTNCIRALEAVHDYSIAMTLAEQVLWDLESKNSEDWALDGTFEDNPAFAWHEDHVYVEDSKLEDVKLDIKWERRNRIYKLKVNTFIPDEKT